MSPPKKHRSLSEEAMMAVLRERLAGCQTMAERVSVIQEARDRGEIDQEDARELLETAS
jgi:hypothetical protein